MKKYNTLLITVDDLNYNTIACFGSPVKDVSPHLDALCEEGIKLENSFVTIAVSQPSRSVLLTGRYPHKNGARGFEAIDTSCTTFCERLHENGYTNGIIGKEDHLAPKEKFCWDFYVRMLNNENDYGRNPEKYYNYTKEFLLQAQATKKPFFLMANSHDPHRPFAHSKQELDMFGRHLSCDYVYKPKEVDVKSFLPDIPLVRKEMAQYYSSVRRCDKTVGRILDAVKDSGEYDNTLILFLSDNGMAFPFSKTNCYYNSTKSPYIIKLPKDMQKGQVSVCDSLINGIDVTPTLLDIMGIESISNVDGKSFKDCLYTNDECNNDIFTLFFKTSMSGHFPMRSVISKKYIYIYNGWSNGTTQFKNESMSGLTFAAMRTAGKTDPEIQKRVDLCLYRVTEEFYDIQNDSDCLINLQDDLAYTDILNSYRLKMKDYMHKSQDGYEDRFTREVIRKIPKTKYFV